MTISTLRGALAALALGTGLATALPTVAAAQNALPTAPAADRAVTAAGAPATAAKASLPGYGGSPLEPWLVVWLLPISGLLSVLVATGTDRWVRASRPARTAR